MPSCCFALLLICLFPLALLPHFSIMTGVPTSTQRPTNNSPLTAPAAIASTSSGASGNFPGDAPTKKPPATDPALTVALRALSTEIGRKPKDLAVVLRQTQLSFIDDPDERLRDSKVWAPFVLVEAR